MQLKFTEIHYLHLAQSHPGNHTPLMILAQQNYFSLLLIFALRCIKRDFHLADLVSHKKKGSKETQPEKNASGLRAFMRNELVGDI